MDIMTSTWFMILMIVLLLALIGLLLFLRSKKQDD
jgi:LPXTG-motif cell wall-anchored protein